MRQRRPDFLAVYNINIILFDSLCFQRRQVTAGAGLGIALAPEVLAPVDARQESLLLRVAAELQQYRGAHLQAERNERRAAGVAPLLLEDVALHHTPAGAAPFLGPGR